MAGRLDMRQRNNLHIGNTLAAEILPTAASRRAIVVLTPYHADPRPKKRLTDHVRRKPFPKVLNTQGEFDDDVRFACSVVEVEEAALQSYLEEAAVAYDADLELHTRSARTDLASVEELETELCGHLEDLARLEVRWRGVPWDCGRERRTTRTRGRSGHGLP